MANIKIAPVLKKYRKQNDLSVHEVSKKLKERSLNVAEKTIYGWESGQAQPNADTFMILCDIYHINDVLKEFCYTDRASFTITRSEQELIKKYREHPELHEAIHKLLDLD